MSKSNPRLQNPATKFIEFKGDTGQFFWYDKVTEEKKELVMPFYFVVLDELCCIKGYNNRIGSGIYSNEIRSIKDDILSVKSFKGNVQIIGKYKDIKDNALREGGKFCKSVYAMLILDKGVYELVNFQFHGASFSGTGENCKSGWMNKKIDVEKFGVVVKETEQGVTGKVTYLAPIFSSVRLNPDVDQAAINMDKQLQIYLSSYLNHVIEKESVTEIDPEPPFYSDVSERAKEVRDNATTQSDTEDDLPF